MSATDGPVICDLCREGQVEKRMEEIAFRQWSDKGYVHCRVLLAVGVCNKCGAKSLDTTSKILDEVFQQEYDKLP